MWYMTSAQNHLLPLNGNKQILIALLALTSLPSCALLQSLFGEPEEPEVIVVDPEPEDTTTVDITDLPEDTTTREDEITEDTGSGKWRKKDSYTISYILPFEVDKQELDRLMEEENPASMQSLGAIEFYEGVQLALDTLEKLGVNMDVYLFNDDRRESTLQKTLNRKEVQNTDVVVGPIFTDGLSLAQEWGKDKEVFVVSPFSPSDVSVTDNPFFIMVNATMPTQLTTLCRTMLQTSDNPNVVILQGNGPSDSIITAYIQEAYNEMGFRGYKPSPKVTRDVDGIEDLLVQDMDNIIFMGSADELFVNGAMRKLSLQSKTYDIRLAGLPFLLDMESLSLDYFENLSFHYPTAYWLNPYSPRLEAFNALYAETYGSNPTEFACKGYDLTLQLAASLTEHGPYLTETIQERTRANLSLYPFSFGPKWDDNGLMYIENSAVTVLRYENYRFEKAEAQ